MVKKNSKVAKNVEIIIRLMFLGIYLLEELAEKSVILGSQVDFSPRCKEPTLRIAVPIVWQVGMYNTL